MRSTPRRDSYKYIYVAVMSGHTKIGVTANIKRRMRGCKLVRVWEHDAPADIESICCDAWTNRRARCREFFEATPEEAVAHVEAVLVRYASGERPISNALRARLKKGKRLQALMDSGMSFLDAAKQLRPDLRLAAGERIPVIADRLDLAESTIRKHWSGERLQNARMGIKSKPE